MRHHFHKQTCNHAHRTGENLPSLQRPKFLLSPLSPAPTNNTRSTIHLPHRREQIFRPLLSPVFSVTTASRTSGLIVTTESMASNSIQPHLDSLLTHLTLSTNLAVSERPLDLFYPVLRPFNTSPCLRHHDLTSIWRLPNTVSAYEVSF